MIILEEEPRVGTRNSIILDRNENFYKYILYIYPHRIVHF